MWMQSEPRWPRIILSVYPRPRGEECAKDRDPFMRTGRTCMSTRNYPRNARLTESSAMRSLMSPSSTTWPTSTT